MLVALDLDRGELERNPSAHRVHADAEALPIASESVDLIESSVSASACCGETSS